MSHNTLYLFDVWCARASRAFLSYWAIFSRQLQIASWSQVLVACFMVLIAGIVLHLTTLAKVIVTISMLNKLFLHHFAKKKVIPMLDPKTSKSDDGGMK